MGNSKTVVFIQLNNKTIAGTVILLGGE